MNENINVADVREDVKAMNDDLLKSGLVHKDIGARPLDNAARIACNLSQSVQGYIIPYYSIYGKPIPFYRTKITKGRAADGPKYIQVKDSPNHVYFPKNFLEVFHKIGRKFIMITEGEKKAAISTKMGFPCVAFGGTDSWQSRTIIVPKGSELVGNATANSAIKIRLPAANYEEVQNGPYAIGFQELMDLAAKYGSTLFIIYDTDEPNGLATRPQRAAARLGYEIRSRGFHLHQVRQIILPHLDENFGGVGKIALDDYMVHDKGGVMGMTRLMVDNLERGNAFPRHPAIREHLGKILGKARIPRQAMQNLSLAIITELDAGGSRMRSPENLQTYYFDNATHHLMKVNINEHNKDSIHETDFGKYMYQKFGIAAAADSKLMQWIGAHITGEEPLSKVNPHRICPPARDGENAVRFQINNGQYIKVTSGSKEPAFKINYNGMDDTLFESKIEQGIDANELMKEIERQMKLPLRMYWREVLNDVRLKTPEMADGIALLYYMSPFLNRWKGAQMPVEIIVGESGSGKSSLYEIRLKILTSTADLRGVPKDQQDWHAAIASSGGLHVTDNVNLGDKKLRQQMSDDLCRLVTEPKPKIQMRKYFTEADLRTISIDSVFAFTAINQPFPNQDLIQRSIIYELSKEVETNAQGQLKSTEFDSHWKERQLARFGGRLGWVAHHMIALHKFFQLAEKEWDDNYKSKYRLINFEQAMMLMGKVFGVRDPEVNIPTFLSTTTDNNISSANDAIKGLMAFNQWVRHNDVAKLRDPKFEFNVLFIAEWMSVSEEFGDIFTLTNPRSLGKYIQSNKYVVAELAGIIDTGRKYANRAMYRCVNPKQLK